MNKKILVIDDEPSIVTLLKYNLEQAGYRVFSAEDGQSGLEMVSRLQPDCIILDIMLPIIDGIEICKRLRRDSIYIPIMMLTARNEEFDKIIGLELGADDYMTKPFSPREVVARVKALLRRVKFLQQEKINQEESSIVIADLSIEPNAYLAYYKDEALDLTRKEFELLQYLVTHRNRVITRETLLKEVWQYDFSGDSRIVDVHISNLRDKIEIDSKNPQYIKTIRGIGYKMEASINEKIPN